jgi:branched-chain amino acid transport system permease protein
MNTTPIRSASIGIPYAKPALGASRLSSPVLAFAMFIAAGVAVMYIASGYLLLQATQILVFSIAILGLNILSGYNGQVSLGHGAFLAIGGYATAVLITQFGVPFWLAVPIAGVASLVVGLMIGLPALRLEMLYLALATFSLAIAVPQLLKNKFVESWTGGVLGLQIPKAQPWTALGLDRDQTIYLYALTVAVIVFVSTVGLLRGRVGRALEAIREHPLAAETMGVDVRRYKTAAFGVSALLTGIAGGIGAVLTAFVAPDSYSFFLSITMLVGAVIGGLRSVFGALFGAVFVVLMPNYAEQISQAAPWAIYGVFLILFMYFMPNGVMGVLRSAWSRLTRSAEH